MAELEKLPSIEDRGQTDRDIMPTPAELRRCRIQWSRKGNLQLRPSIDAHTTPQNILMYLAHVLHRRVTLTFTPRRAVITSYAKIDIVHHLVNQITVESNGHDRLHYFSR